MSSHVYRDLADRLTSLSTVLEGVGIWINGEWSPCWVWLGPLNSSGRPRICLRTLRGKTRVPRNRIAYRVAFEMLTGSTVPEGLVLRHRCALELCIHPNHVVPGTQAQNVQDQFARGTHCTQLRRSRVPGEDDE